MSTCLKTIYLSLFLCLVFVAQGQGSTLANEIDGAKLYDFVRSYLFIGSADYSNPALFRQLASFTPAERTEIYKLIRERSLGMTRCYDLEEKFQSAKVLHELFASADNSALYLHGKPFIEIDRSARKAILATVLSKNDSSVRTDQIMSCDDKACPYLYLYEEKPIDIAVSLARFIANGSQPMVMIENTSPVHPAIDVSHHVDDFDKSKMYFQVLKCIVTIPGECDCDAAMDFTLHLGEFSAREKTEINRLQRKINIAEGRGTEPLEEWESAKRLDEVLTTAEELALDRYGLAFHDLPDIELKALFHEAQSLYSEPAISK